MVTFCHANVRQEAILKNWQSIKIAALGMGFYLAILEVISIARFFPDQLKESAAHLPQA